MPRKTGVLVFLAILVVFLFLSPVLAEPEEHVYYGYVPVGTDAGAPNSNQPSFPKRRLLEELINGVIYNFTTPEETCILDVIGIHDNTNVEIWDILAKQKLGSESINRLEKYTTFIKFGTFFKVVADKRVSVYETGGVWFHGSNGDTTFYPSDDGGFIGKKFTFTPPPFPNAYITYRTGSNFLCTALEDTHVTIYDSTGEQVMAFDLKQGASLPYNQGRLIPRHYFGGPTHGGGDSVIMYAESTGLVAIRTVNQRSFLAVPAATGGFVGKLFVTPAIIGLDERGAEEVIIVVPIEPGKVSVYDNKINLLTEKSFTQSDIDDEAYWYHSLGKSSQTIILKSTCKMTVLEGATYIPAELSKTTIGIEDLGSNIAYVGARAGEETRFYVPETAIAFAPQDLTVTVDGETKELRKDEFVLLERGVRSLTPDHDMIIQLDCPGNIMEWLIWGGPKWTGGDTGEIIEVKHTYWTDWGSYLISVQDVEKTFEVPKGFAETAAGGMDLTLIAGVAILVAAAAGGGFFILKKRRSR